MKTFERLRASDPLLWDIGLGDSRGLIQAIDFLCNEIDEIKAGLTANESPKDWQNCENCKHNQTTTMEPCKSCDIVDMSGWEPQ